MKNYNSTFAAELEKEQLNFFIALKLSFASTYYYSDVDRPVHYDGQRYLPLDMKVSNINYASSGSVDYVTLDIANQNLNMSALLLGEDVRNKQVTIYIGELDLATHQVIGLEEIFIGLLSEYQIEEDQVQIQVANELILWRKKPLRSLSATCPWDFKGTECAYAGEAEWCDKNYSRCSVLSNTSNFGGFRFLPEMAEKVIWWGRSPK
jgi:phage-related protein